MKKIFIIILILGIFTTYYLYNSYSKFKNGIIITEKKIIQIESGSNINNLAKKLNVNSYFLKKYIKENKEDFQLLAGKFEIKESSKIEDILKGLKRPLPEKEISITMLEGWNIYDIDEHLHKKELIEKGEYIKYVENSEKIVALTEFYEFLYPELTSLEGYLYPDTYSLRSPLKINELVIKQLDTFEKKVYTNILKERNLSKEKIYDLINLSSIVEKEEKNNNEKSIVAGILKKRLNSGWMIGADITVCYPHKLTSEECKLVVSKYINEKSEYNTRTKFGLPKTPIANPSDITVDATLNDKKTKYWFYLHNVKTGKIYYAETNREHESNKKYMY